MPEVEPTAEPSNPPTDPNPGAAAPGASPPSDPPAAISPADSGAQPQPAGDGADGGDAPTLGAGGGEPEPSEAAPTPADWPDNWPEIMAGGDAKKAARFKRFQSPVALGNSWLASQQKIGSGELVRSKPDGSPEQGGEQALNEWRASAGIPEKAEGYLEKLPNGLVIGEADQELVNGYIETMHAADAPPEFVHQVLAWYYDNEEKIAKERSEADKQGRALAEDELRAEWGPDYRPNINGIHALLDSQGIEGLKEKFFGARLADGTPLGDDPDTLRFLAGLERERNPQGTVVPAQGKTQIQTIEAEMAQLRTEMADTKGKTSDYWQNPGKQARWRELSDMLEAHNARGG